MGILYTWVKQELQVHYSYQETLNLSGVQFSSFKTVGKTGITGITLCIYNTHSFHIGAATSLKEVGVSDMYIKKLGRWQCDAFQQYVKPQASKLACFFLTVGHLIKHLILYIMHYQCLIIV